MIKPYDDYFLGRSPTASFALDIYVQVSSDYKTLTSFFFFINGPVLRTVTIDDSSRFCAEGDLACQKHLGLSHSWTRSRAPKLQRSLFLYLLSVIHQASVLVSSILPINQKNQQYMRKIDIYCMGRKNPEFDMTSSSSLGTFKLSTMTKSNGEVYK